MSVTEKTAACTLPSGDTPGCGCSEKAKAVGEPGGKVAGAAVLSALAAVACASCCILPFTLPAVLLADVGGSLAVLDHAHGWVTRAAIVAVTCAWCWVGVQIARTRRKPTRSTVIMMLLATVLTAMAASWPLIEPIAFDALGIVKKRPVLKSDWHDELGPR
jgi:hypothetical protein